MNRFLDKFNLFGVLALAILCMVQWRVNRAAHLETIDLKSAQAAQSSQISDLLKTIEGQTADLEMFRGQIGSAKTAANETERKLAEAQRAIARLEAERTQLKSSLSNWSAAVAARDEQLNTYAAETRKLLDERNAAVEKRNELAEKFNSVVADLNEARAKLKELAAAR